VSRAGSKGRCNTCAQFTRWSLKAQSFSRALIETQRNFVQLGLRVDGKVGSLRYPSHGKVRDWHDGRGTYVTAPLVPGSAEFWK
jgi:hypothetical protein